MKFFENLRGIGFGDLANLVSIFLRYPSTLTLGDFVMQIGRDVVGLLARLH